MKPARATAAATMTGLTTTSGRRDASCASSQGTLLLDSHHRAVSPLVAIAVNEDGYREVLGAAEGMKEDKASWVNFFQWLKGRGLDGVKLIVGDKYPGMLEAVGEVFPDAKYQRCTVHFYRNVFSVVPRSKVKLVAKMLKAIHAQESKNAAREKAKAVVAQLREMKLKEAAKKVEDSVEETLAGPGWWGLWKGIVPILVCFINASSPS